MNKYLLLFALCIPALAQTPLQPANFPVFRALDQNGKPLSGGKLFSYQAGTTTPLAIYTDPAGMIPATNPVILDSTGSACRPGGGCGIYLKDASYKLVLKNQFDVVQWTVDDLVGTQSSIIANPTGDQIIAQPVGTTLGVKSLNNVLNASLFPGVDAGEKINAAYAALPAGGGMIIYPVKSGGETFGTDILFGTQNKPAVLSCQGASGAGNDRLTYTGGGTGITIDDGPVTTPNGPIGSGIRDCEFRASNTSATLLFLGGGNGAEGVMIRDSRFQGGALTVGMGNNAWDVKFDHVKIYSGTQLFVTSGTVNAGENIQLDHVVFVNSDTFANGVVLGGGGSGAGLNLQCNSCSFDNVQLVVTGGEIEINSTHFEDPGAVAWPAPPMIVNGGSVALNTATFFEDHAADPTPPPTISSYISVTNGTLTTDALDAFGCLCTNIYTSSGTGKIIGHTPFTLNGAPGVVVNLIADTSSEPSTVDGGREYALHADGPYSILGWVDFLTGGGTHYRSNETPDNKQAGTGNYVTSLGMRLVDSPDLLGYFTSKIQSSRCGVSGYSSQIDFYTERKASGNKTDTSTIAATLDCNKALHVPAIISTGPTFTITGCSATGAVGGATVGQFVAGTTGTCTVVITMGNGITANGWACGRPNDISDASKSASWGETAFTPTTVTLSGTAAASELIQFSCVGY